MDFAAREPSTSCAPLPIVLDTNIVLDLFVYNDPLQVNTKKALQAGSLQWHMTQGMQGELVRVLSYPQIERRLAASHRTAQEVLQEVAALVAVMAPTAPKAPYTCKDPDDQLFIDLACQLQCLLLSKDKAVLAMRSRLARLGAAVLHSVRE